MTQSTGRVKVTSQDIQEAIRICTANELNTHARSFALAALLVRLYERGYNAAFDELEASYL